MAATFDYISIIRIIPVTAASALLMCRFDQHFIWNSYLASYDLDHTTAQSLPHIFKSFMNAAVPPVIFLEFLSYTAQAVNIYHSSTTRTLYSWGLGISLLHLLNAPYSWTLIQKIGNMGAKNEERQNALREFVRMNLLRVAFIDVPVTALLLYTMMLQ